jgi:hypothetical protein
MSFVFFIIFDSLSVGQIHKKQEQNFLLVLKNKSKLKNNKCLFIIFT